LGLGASADAMVIDCQGLSHRLHIRYGVTADPVPEFDHPDVALAEVVVERHAQGRW